MIAEIIHYIFPPASTFMVGIYFKFIMGIGLVSLVLFGVFTLYDYIKGLFKPNN